MIPYKAQAKKSPKTDQTAWYAQMADTQPMALDEVTELIEKRSTVSSADCKAVLDALQYEVFQALRNGKTVRLGDLGSFRPTLTSDGAPDRESVGVQLIRRVRVRFTPSGKLSKLMQKDNNTFRNISAPADSGEEAALAE